MERVAGRVSLGRNPPPYLSWMRPLAVSALGHSTSFSPTGQVVGHLLPSAPEPLPRLEVRELDGSIDVFVAEKPPTEPA